MAMETSVLNIKLNAFNASRYSEAIPQHDGTHLLSFLTPHLVSSLLGTPKAGVLVMQLSLDRDMENVCKAFCNNRSSIVYS